MAALRRWRSEPAAPSLASPAAARRWLRGPSGAARGAKHASHVRRRASACGHGCPRPPARAVAVLGIAALAGALVAGLNGPWLRVGSIVYAGEQTPPSSRAAVLAPAQGVPSRRRSTRTGSPPSCVACRRSPRPTWMRCCPAPCTSPLRRRIRPWSGRRRARAWWARPTERCSGPCRRTPSSRPSSDAALRRRPPCR